MGLMSWDFSRDIQKINMAVTELPNRLEGFQNILILNLLLCRGETAIRFLKRQSHLLCVPEEILYKRELKHHLHTK